MRLHRLTWVAVDAWQDGRLADNDPWGPLYVSTGRQGASRFDNPSRYAMLYAAKRPEAAYAEVFAGNVARVGSDALVHAGVADVARCLVTVELREPHGLCNLDDPAVLVELGIRPSEVVRRDRETTQDVAHRIWLEGRHTGLTWWSFYNPSWTVCGVWSDRIDDDRPDFERVSVVDVVLAALDDAALRVAARRCRFDVDTVELGAGD